jgi:cell division protein FtsW
MAGIKLKSDTPLFVAAGLLVCSSLVMVYTASAATADQTYHILTKQLMWVALGVPILVLTMRIDYRHYNQPLLIRVAVAGTILALAAVLFTSKIGGSSRWFNLGGASIQPSEFAKLALILFTAATLEQRMARINEIRYSLLPLGLVLGAVAFLIFREPDYGTMAAVCAIVLAMVFAAGLSYRHVAVAALLGVPALAVALILEPYRMKRLVVFFNDPFKDRFGVGFQPIQSMIAVATGGVTGRGLGLSTQRFGFLPDPNTDFIYAVICEEQGLIGATVILACFCVIAWRGLRIANRAPDAFGSLLAIGVTVMITLQAFANMSIVLSLLPNKGISLPFVSYGGSSMLTCLIGLGILLNVSNHAQRGSAASVVSMGRNKA